MKKPIDQWVEENKISDEMIWKDSALQQIKFVKNKLAGLVAHEYGHVFVISEHRSKSILLPVYLIEGNKLQIILRDNFYNWKMSVISEETITADFKGLFHTSPPIDPEYTGDPLNEVYFEGFPQELIFGYYDNSDKKKWSAEISTDYLLYTTLFILCKNIGIIKPFEWSKRNDK